MVILGCDHAVQSPEQPTGAMTDRHESFSCLIQQIVEAYAIQFIGEETDREVSIAQKIAGILGLRYAIIDVPPDVKKQVLYPRFEPDGPYESFEQFIFCDPYARAWNLVREYHIAESFFQRAGFDNALLICGRLHVQGIAQLFGKRGLSIISVCFGSRNEYCCNCRSDINARS